MPNPVFALRAFSKLENGEFKPDGFLLFPNEKKSEGFLEMCELMNRKQKTCHYEKHEYVEVNEFVTNRVVAQNHFFVRNLEQNKPE